MCSIETHFLSYKPHESLCVKSRAEYEGPMGVSIGPFCLDF